MKYIDNVKIFCQFDWNDTTVSKIDRNGGYGIAIMMAFLSGVPPVLKALSEHLGESTESLQFAYENLIKSGMLSRSFYAKNDSELLGNGISPTAVTVKFNEREDKLDYQIWSKEKAILNAWGHVAAIASGVISRNIDKQRNKV